MKRPFTLAIIFIIGCATGGVASQFTVPPVRAGTSPTRWEYLCTAASRETVGKHLKPIGQEGWEMVSAMVQGFETMKGFGETSQALAYTFCFKRALP